MQNQFIALQPWLGKILQSIKKEIKSEHLAKSPAFHRKLFGNRPLNRLTAEEILKGYEEELLQGNEELSEWIVNRWVFQHGDIYQHFADRLSKIDPDFSAISQLDAEQTASVLEGAAQVFGSLNTYAFCVLNRVVLDPSGFATLRSDVEREEVEQKAVLEEKREKEAIEQLRMRYERDLARVQEKCEQKIAGVMKKYASDTQALKQQIRSLQAKLQQNLVETR